MIFAFLTKNDIFCSDSCWHKNPYEIRHVIICVLIKSLDFLMQMVREEVVTVEKEKNQEVFTNNWWIQVGKCGLFLCCFALQLVCWLYISIQRAVLPFLVIH